MIGYLLWGLLVVLALVFGYSVGRSMESIERDRAALAQWMRDREERGYYYDEQFEELYGSNRDTR